MIPGVNFLIKWLRLKPPVLKGVGQGGVHPQPSSATVLPSDKAICNDLSACLKLGLKEKYHDCGLSSAKLTTSFLHARLPFQPPSEQVTSQMDKQKPPLPADRWNRLSWKNPCMTLTECLISLNFHNKTSFTITLLVFDFTSDFFLLFLALSLSVCDYSFSF